MKGKEGLLRLGDAGQYRNRNGRAVLMLIWKPKVPDVEDHRDCPAPSDMLRAGLSRQFADENQTHVAALHSKLTAVRDNLRSVTRTYQHQLDSRRLLRAFQLAFL